MDNSQVTEPAAESVEQAGAAASPSSQESESSLMNRLIRGVGGMFSRDDGASRDTPEQSDAQAEATPPPESDRVTLTRAELDARERAWQSQKDREVAQTRLQLTRDHALQQADQGNLAPIRELAERDPWARHKLSESGDVWARGEIAVKEDLAAQAAESVAEQVTGVALHFDQAYLEPLLAALPDQAEANRLRQSTVGMEGRAQTTQAAIKAIQQHAAAEATTKALSDEGFVSSLFKSEGFRSALIKNPVANKQLRSFFRGELDEPDLNPGAGPGRGGERENDVMNEMIRGLARGAELRSDTERAAGAGASNGRRAHRDALDDD